MSPVTVAGTCAQTLAEALAGMAFVQLCNPGAPVMLGSFASSMSMQSGAPTFGTPEPALVLYVMAALARRMGVPFRSGGGCAAPRSPMRRRPPNPPTRCCRPAWAGVNFVLHTAGWLEGGLSMGYEKFVMDVRPGRHDAHAAGKGVDMSENGQAMDAIAKSARASTSWAVRHTQANFETAFYRSPITDNNSFEQWVEDGSQDAEQRAEKLYKEMLASYTAPELDPDVDAKLIAFMEQKKASFPDSNIS
jgi:trimethylamine--corrinoid protein Co-methyltransferase